MNIAICDDDSIFRGNFREELERKLDDINQKNDNKYEINIDEFSSGEDFIAGCDHMSYDCVFLDLYMGGMTGFDTATQLVHKNKETKIIFLTSNSALVYDSFEYQPFYFLKKDNYRDTLAKALNKLKNVLDADGIFLLDGRSDYENIPVGSICYITSDKHDIVIQTTKFCYEMRKSISEAESELAKYSFVRIHKKYLVNLRYVKRVNMRDDNVVMYDDTVLDMSRRIKNEVMEKYRAYQRSVNSI